MDSPNPDEHNTDPFTDGHPVRATWQHSRDTSAVWAGSQAFRPYTADYIFYTDQ